METYITPLLTAVVIFPLLAGIFTIPYILFQYHKYGAIPILRVIIVYSFILYLTSAYFLVIMPLPSIGDVAKMTGPQTQLVPFQFISDFLKNTSLVWNNPGTYLQALKEPYVYQWLYNIFLTVPFGIYLHYYFKCSWKKTIFMTFLLTLFFEVTQLTGLYGIYPRSYRLFDVDDLFLNTLGGILGYLCTPLVERILPTREELDKTAYQRGKKISALRRLSAFLVDGFLFLLYTVFGGAYLSKVIENRLGVLPIFLISFFFYYVLLPMINQGRTLGKHFLKMKVISTNEKKTKWYQILVRNTILYLGILSLPWYLLLALEKVGTIFHWNTFYYSMSLVILILFTFGYYLFLFAKGAIRKKPLMYERISKTMNISTVAEKEWFSPEIVEKEKSNETEEI